MTEQDEFVWSNRADGIADRERSVLQSLLEEPYWDSHDARLFLAGLDREGHDAVERPQDGREISMRYRRFLPGGREQYIPIASGATDWSLVELQVKDELRNLAHFIEGKPRKSYAWLQISLEAGYEPCWLPSLQAHSDFVEIAKKFSGLFASDLGADRLDPGKQSVDETDNAYDDTTLPKNSASRGGEAKRKYSRQYKAKCLIVQAWDKLPELEKTNPHAFARKMDRLYYLPVGQYRSPRETTNNLSNGQYISPEELAISNDGSPRATTSSIKRWISQLRKETPESQWIDAQKIRREGYGYAQKLSSLL